MRVVAGPTVLLEVPLARRDRQAAIYLRPALSVVLASVVGPMTDKICSTSPMSFVATQAEGRPKTPVETTRKFIDTARARRPLRRRLGIAETYTLSPPIARNTLGRRTSMVVWLRLSRPTLARLADRLVST